MVALHQLVAVVSGLKERSKNATTAVYQSFEKAGNCVGETRTYQPLDGDDPDCPEPTVKLPQVNIAQQVKSAFNSLEAAWDTVVSLDMGNQAARETVRVEDKNGNELALATDVPITTLIWLEKQLTDLVTFISKIPTLDPAKNWAYDSNREMYVTDALQSNRTKKRKRFSVMVQPTEHHPAQTMQWEEDEVVGHYSTQYLSTAIPVNKKTAMLQRAVNLRDAVKQARERANQQEVRATKAMKNLLDHVLGDL